MPPPPPANGERLIRILSQHWIKYVFPAFVYCVLLAVSLLLFALAGIAADDAAWLSHIAYAAALTLFLILHHWFFLTLLCESAAHIVITSHRVVWMREQLFVNECMQEYAFDKMKTVEARKRGVLQTVLRYGTLQFEKSGTIPLVPHPNSVARDIEQAMGLR